MRRFAGLLWVLVAMPVSSLATEAEGIEARANRFMASIAGTYRAQAGSVMELEISWLEKRVRGPHDRAVEFEKSPIQLAWVDSYAWISMPEANAYFSFDEAESVTESTTASGWYEWVSRRVVSRRWVTPSVLHYQQVVHSREGRKAPWRAGLFKEFRLEKLEDGVLELTYVDLEIRRTAVQLLLKRAD